jgi:hypothetical protein
MVLRRIERAKGYRCYNKELPDMSTSWREIPASILALIPVSTISEGNRLKAELVTRYLLRYHYK